MAQITINEGLAWLKTLKNGPLVAGSSWIVGGAKARKR